METTVVCSPLVGRENVLQVHNRAVLSHEKETVLCTVDGTGDCYAKGKQTSNEREYTGFIHKWDLKSLAARS